MTNNFLRRTLLRNVSQRRQNALSAAGATSSKRDFSSGSDVMKVGGYWGGREVQGRGKGPPRAGGGERVAGHGAGRASLGRRVRTHGGGAPRRGAAERHPAPDREGHARRNAAGDGDRQPAR